MKRFIMIMLAFLLVLSLTACGKKEDNRVKLEIGDVTIALPEGWEYEDESFEVFEVYNLKDSNSDQLIFMQSRSDFPADEMDAYFENILSADKKTQKVEIGKLSGITGLISDFVNGENVEVKGYELYNYSTEKLYALYFICDEPIMKDILDQISK